jgi:putative ABC transport system permease protein
MKVFKLIYKNALRHKLRTVLTVLGIAVAVFSFGLIRTIIDAWYAGVEASAQNRLVTRSAVSLVMPLPLAYREQLAKIPGVQRVANANWFGGIYKDPKNFFANFAVDADYLAMYPEFVVPPEQMEQYLKERNACLVGRKLAAKFGWKLGQTVQLTGTIFPGDWDFVIRGIYHGVEKGTDETAFMFHWNYLNERIRGINPYFADNVGWYMVQIAGNADAAAISQKIDAQFKNSFAETLTETERAFQQSFVAMSGTIILAMRVISIVVIFIILLVLANTIAMGARERMSEYAVLKTLGFRPFHVMGLIGGESMLIAILGFGVGGVFSIFAIRGIGDFITENIGNFFPIFELKNQTLVMAFGASIVVGIAAALFPVWHAVKMRIADGLRQIG